MKATLAALILILIAHGAAGQTPVRQASPRIGTATDSLIVKWRTKPTEASTSARLQKLTRLKGATIQRKQDITESLEVVQLDRLLEGDELNEVLEDLQADPQIEYAAADLRRHIHTLPSDPLVVEQWYLLSNQPAATRTDQAWDISTGSMNVVAVLDTGARFEHPDLGRVEQGGKLLPGYDFVTRPVIANDGDGRDSDPTDPGDWVNDADLQNPELRNCATTASSWHGTRVAGMIGANTNNALGIAGAAWNTVILPIRVLGKCGGVDSDIIAGMRWAAGLSVAGVPANPTPARIINLSLGGEGACSSAYQAVVSELSSMGVLIVVSVGNEGSTVAAPANCPGALGVAGIRHAGTKVGFSNLGATVGLSAPAGNCVNTGFGQPCLFSLIVATNNGTTSPGASTYSDAINYNVGTSFSAPLVASAAALMQSANSKLNGEQLIALLKETAMPFPVSTAAGVPQCREPTGPGDLQTAECNCTTQTCGSGMLNTSAAVLASRSPFAIVQGPSLLEPGVNVTIDARSSFAADNRSIATYQWSIVGLTGTAPSLADAAQAVTTLQVTGNSQFTLRLTVTDDAGAQDSADLAVATPIAPVVPSAPPPSSPGPSSGGGGGGGHMHWVLLMLLATGLSRLRRVHRSDTV